MKIAITDANIFIDLFILEILDELFLLRLEIHTTIEVIDELDKEQTAFLKEKEQAGKLVIYSMTAEELDSLNGYSLSRGLSQTDKTVYFYSQLVKGIVLTGDRKLRTTLEGNGKEVHGIIWIFEKWVDGNIMDKVIAAEKLEELVQLNPFLPQEECFDRINNWRK